MSRCKLMLSPAKKIKSEEVLELHAKSSSISYMERSVESSAEA